MIKMVTEKSGELHFVADITPAMVRSFLRTYSQNREMDILFDVPTLQLLESLVRPTINFYLFDIRENTDLRQTDWLPSQSNGRSSTRRMPPRRFDLRFMVSAIADNVETEHQLLWWTLRTLLQHPELPPKDWKEKWEGLSPEAFAQLELLEAPLPTRIGDKEDSARLLDIWSALDAPPRPALVYIVTVPMDLDITQHPKLVFTRTLRYRDTVDEAPADEWHHIAGTVTKDGMPVAGAVVTVERQAVPKSAKRKKGVGGIEVFTDAVNVIAEEQSNSGESKGFIQKEIGCRTDALGRYVVQSLPSGEVTLRVWFEGKDYSRKVVVPSLSYNIEL